MESKETKGYDEDIAEIPAQVFKSWLDDTSNIINRSQKRKLSHLEMSISKTIMNTPSTFLSWNRNEFCSSWPADLMELWHLNLSGRSINTQEGPRMAPQQSAQDDWEDENEAPIIQEPEDPVYFEAEQNFGSVERLRNAVRTPHSPNEEDSIAPTSSLSAATATAARCSGQRSGQSERLVFDNIESEYPTSGRSKRSRVSERGGSVSPLGIELCKRDLPEIITPLVKAQDDVFEEMGVGPSQAASPRNNIDRMSIAMLRCLPDNFNEPSAPIYHSLNELADGLDRCQAAKLFFQICVLVSNRYLTVMQKEGYGDIEIGRGQYL